MYYVISFIVALIDVALLKSIKGIVENATQWTFEDISNVWIPFDSSVYGNLSSTAETIFELLAPIGCGLVIVFFFLELINQLAKDNLTGYTLLKSGVQLIFAFGVIMYGYKLCTTITGIGTWFINSVGKSTLKMSTPEVSNFIIIPGLHVPSNEMLDSGFMNSAIDIVGTHPFPAFHASFSWLGEIADWLLGITSIDDYAKSLFLLIGALFGVILAVFYWLFMQIIHLILILQCVSRAIQIAIYSAMAPIGIVAWFSGGSITTSTAMRYIKKLIALSIQGGIMGLIMILATSISADNSNLFLTFIGPITAIALFGKSNQIANDVCGT